MQIPRDPRVARDPESLCLCVSVVITRMGTASGLCPFASGAKAPRVTVLFARLKPRPTTSDN